MADFLRQLPTPRSTSNTHTTLVDPSLASFSTHTSTYETKQITHTHTHIPKYGQRKNGRWLPKKLSDFGDGGAYPEIHTLQYPLDMGKTITTTKKTIPLQIGEDGKLQYDAIIKQSSTHTHTHTRPEHQNSTFFTSDKLQKPDPEEIQNSVEETKLALNLTHTQLTPTETIAANNQISKPEFIKYTPNPDAPGRNPNFSQRIIKMVEKPKDPLEVAKFKNKRAPAAPPSPPPAVQHSPPRKLTLKDQQEWKIPPSVSNWKNQKGYTIPLDKRIQACGRGLQEVTVNDKFAALSESLYVAERSAREEIRIRNNFVKQMKLNEQQIKENKLRELAAQSLLERERSNMLKHKEDSLQDSEARQERENIEKQRKRELEREYRLKKAGKSRKIGRDEDRDISERVALGQAQPTSQQTLFDARLFNQTSGLSSGYEGGNDDDYNVYDKPLFADKSSAGIYQFSKERFQQNVGEELNLPSFSGAIKSAAERTAPVEFEKDMADPFGLDNLLSEAKKSDRK